MTESVGSYLKALVWALVGSIILGVATFPLGGSSGLAGLRFVVYHTLSIYLIAVILFSYPTQDVPVYRRFLGYRGVESSMIFVLIIEAAFCGLIVAFVLARVIVGVLGWWTGLAGPELAAAHFVVSAAILLYAWHRSRETRAPGWYIGPLAGVLALMLVPLAYQGVLFG
ncbi:MAG: hypothetical protein HKM95_12070 [Inquilinus sp.]|nr:hypothetical protein [Inquilinus sp.]